MVCQDTYAPNSLSSIQPAGHKHNLSQFHHFQLFMWNWKRYDPENEVQSPCTAAAQGAVRMHLDVVPWLDLSHSQTRHREEHPHFCLCSDFPLISWAAFIQAGGAKQQISSGCNGDNWNSLLSGELTLWERLNKYQETVSKRLSRFCHVKPVLEKYFY